MSLTRIAPIILKALPILVAAGLVQAALSSPAASAAPTQRPAAGLPSTVVSLSDVSHVYGPGYTQATARVVGNHDAVQGANVIGADGSQLLRTSDLMKLARIGDGRIQSHG